MLKEIAQRYIANRPHEIGETVQVGWFVLRIASASTPAEIETLDFKRVASFTTDFTRADAIFGSQLQLLKTLGVESEECTLRHTAVVSRSYSPSREDVVMCRQSGCHEADSGWYIGVEEEPLDMEDVESFEIRSLYELTIADLRMSPYWLLPLDRIITLKNGEILSPESENGA